jgi:hypothetical protein
VPILNREGNVVAAYTIRVIRNDRDSTELAQVTVDTSINHASVSGSPAVDLDLLLRALAPRRATAAVHGRSRRLTSHGRPLRAIPAAKTRETASR